MTTYNSYEAAKIANPESDIFTKAGKFIGECDLGPSPHTYEYRGIAKCNPADHCMTLGELRSKHGGEQEGDLILGYSSGSVKVIKNIDAETRSFDCDCLVLRAAALEEKPSEKVEWVNGDECVFDDRTGVFIGLSNNKRLAIVEIDNELNDHDIDMVRVAELLKPETKQQREDRERLEAAYDLYLAFWSASKSSIILVSYNEFSSRGNSDLKHFLAVVDRTNYRKESK